jgi:GNAT superfamily N-acetyltransferase
MIVVPVEKEDLLAMKDLIPAWFKDHPNMKWVTPATEYVYYNFLSLHDAGVLAGAVLVQDEQLVGSLMGLVSMDLYEPLYTCSEVIYYIEPEYRSLRAAKALFDKFESEAKDKGATRLVFGTTSGHRVQSTKKLYEYLGFVERGGAFTKEV